MAFYGVPVYDPMRDPTTATIRALTQAPIDPSKGPMNVNDFFQFANQQRMRAPMEQELAQRQANEANAVQAWMSGLNKQQEQMKQADFDRGIKIGDEQREQEMHDRRLAEEDDQARKRAEIERTFGVGGVEGARLKHQQFQDERMFKKDAEDRRRWEAEQAQQERFHADTALKAQDKAMQSEQKAADAERKRAEAETQRKVERDSWRDLGATEKRLNDAKADLLKLEARHAAEQGKATWGLMSDEEKAPKIAEYTRNKAALEATIATIEGGELKQKKMAHVRVEYPEMKGASDETVDRFMKMAPVLQQDYLRKLRARMAGG